MAPFDFLAGPMGLEPTPSGVTCQILDFYLTLSCLTFFFVRNLSIAEPVCSSISCKVLDSSVIASSITPITFFLSHGN